MKLKKIQIKIKKKQCTIKKTRGKSVQVEIDGQTKLIDKDKIQEYLSKTVKLYPKMDDEIDFESVAKVEMKSDIVGVLSNIRVEIGDIVKKGEILLSISAMKVENEITSPIDGVVRKIYIRRDQRIQEGSKLLDIENPNFSD